MMKGPTACVALGLVAVLILAPYAAAQTNNNNNNGGGNNNNNNNNNNGVPSSPGGTAPGWWWFSNYDSQWHWCPAANCGGTNVGGYWCGCQIYQAAGCSAPAQQAAPQQPQPQYQPQPQPQPQQSSGGQYIAPGSSQVLGPGNYFLNGKWSVSYSQPTTVSITPDGGGINTSN